MGRLGSRKTTTGCLTCKIRRIKCDEQHPACRRCSSTGRTCDGYSAIQQDTSRQVSKLHSASSPQTIATYGHREAAEIQAFEFFISQVIPDMTRVVDTEFWHTYVLQASQVDDAVWNATNSMAFLIRQLHTQVIDKTENEDTYQSSLTGQQVALQWYNRSINNLQARMQHQRTWSVVCSITAVLYICIECLLDNMQGALFINQQATQAMCISAGPQEINIAHKNDPIQNSVEALLRHITATHGFRVTTKSRLEQPLSAISTCLTDTSDMLYELIGESHQFVCQVESIKQYQPRNWCPPAELFLQQEMILHKLRKWTSIASAIPENKSRPEQTLAVSCILLAQAVYFIWVSAVLNMSEMAYDTYNPTFEAMMNYAETAINAHGTIQPFFSFETRVIACIAFAATRCRHPVIRRRAIALLYRGPKIENTRRALSTIAMAKRIVTIEESGDADGRWLHEPTSLELPPEINRIIWAKVEGDGQSERYLNFGRWRLDDGNEWYKTHEIAKI